MAVSEVFWLAVFCWLSVFTYKYPSIKIQGKRFCYSLQLLTGLSKLKLQRSAIEAMV